MWILMLEAGGALCLFVFIVWWTMFAGREPTGAEIAPPPEHKENDTPGS
jgi:hypothetical protein